MKDKIKHYVLNKEKALIRSERSVPEVSQHKEGGLPVSQNMGDLNFELLKLTQVVEESRLSNLKEMNVLGSISEKDRFCAAVIGSRKMTDYGRRACWAVVKSLVNAGVTIVSGLMYGIDCEAHKSAIYNKGRTIGVAGYGLNHLPKYLYAMPIVSDILRMQAGAVISHFPDNYEPDKWTFIERNRVVAALADIVVVIEASRTSGSLVTAGYAAEIGRDVFALPGSIFSLNSIGCHKLIHEGAEILTSVNDPASFFDAKFKEISGLTSPVGLEENEKIVFEVLAEKFKEGIVVLNRNQLFSLALSKNENVYGNAASFNRILTQLEIRGLINTNLKGVSLAAV